MSSFLQSGAAALLIQLVLSITAIFIILLVLVQRGRGGGLAGALGGPGGSSAFGAKAGDTFTRITIIVVSIWIVMCLLASIWAAHRGDAFAGSDAALAGSVKTAEEPGIGAATTDETSADETATEGETTADGPFLGEGAATEENAAADDQPADE
ncbi:preprotein translocase subunit SecG [Botrimarina colliarenosi]|uniref:Protein-export membrane protein SecG n=1 Tax=Botrimarina colliarenosi TaxID=2528001 RepID=A0A5C6AAS7_9BACT|nr:preprotein translocase subunit SecG [Botrimarina colliarenosi]TWT96151.1 preprotein translocase subunit SecG [Botrimarina colliarenosi]